MLAIRVIFRLSGFPSVPAPNFSPGERVFKPAQTLYPAIPGLKALVRTLRGDDG